jgi:ABC-2 type transport system permease protein
LKTLKELYLANLREFSRDGMALFFTVAFPVLFILLFGMLFRNPGKFDDTVGIALEDQGPIGGQIADILESLPAGQPGEDVEKNPFEKM